MAEIPYVGLTLATLGRLDPMLDVKFKQLMQDASMDCINRRNVKAKRKIKLVISVVPFLDNLGNLDRVELNVAMDFDRPAFNTNENYALLPTKVGLKFNAGDSHSVRQHTIPVDDDESAARLVDRVNGDFDEE